MDSRLLAFLEQQESELIGLLKTLVELPSPSEDKALVDRLGLFVGLWLKENGITPRVHRLDSAGDIVWGDWEGAGPGRILVLCHLDTVWGADALERNPFRLDGERVYGPGIFDMKSGIAATLKIQELLRQGIITPARTVRFLYTTDEETGSFQSRRLVEEFARQCEFVFVTEPPLPGGALKTARKGSGLYRLKVEGKSAHAGLEPEKGINAIEEISCQLLNLKALESREAGTTVTVTRVEGGIGVNVVPDSAQATLDVRFRTVDEARRVEEGLQGLTPHLPGARVTVEGMIDRPPMVKSGAAADLFLRARALAAELGISLEDGEAGGGSDGNLTAAQGIPTLDGLGVEGAGAHAWHEHILRSSIVPRVALLAHLIERL